MCMHIVADTALLTETSFVLDLDQGTLDGRKTRFLPQPWSVMMEPSQPKEFKFILVHK